MKEKKLSKKQILNLFKGKLEGKVIEVSNGFSRAYRKIIEEVKSNSPDYIIAPIGSGEAFVGLYEGIKKYRLKTKLVGVRIRSKNKSLADKLHTIYTPYEKKLNEIKEKGHKIINLNEKEVKIAYDKFRKIVDCEPSAAVVFGALKKIKFSKKDKVLLINSGKGII